MKKENKEKRDKENLKKLELKIKIKEQNKKREIYNHILNFIESDFINEKDRKKLIQSLNFYYQEVIQK